MRKPRYRIHLIVLGLYGLLALGLTWPLVTRLSTHVPGTANWAFDESTFLWNMWWVKYSLLNLGQSPLHTSYIFYPLGIDLVTYTVNFYNALVGLPLSLTLTLPLASNLMLLFSYVMSAFGAYLLARYVLRPHLRAIRPRPPRRGPETLALSLEGEGRGEGVWPADEVGAAFVAGAVYAFAASRMMYAALGHYNFVTVQAFPFFTLFLLKTLREPGYRNPILAGIFTGLNMMAEMTFGVMMFFLGGLILLFEGLQGGHVRIGPGAILRFIIVAMTAAILCAPWLTPVLGAYAQGGFELHGWGEGLKLSADLVGWFTPLALHPLFGVSNWPAHLRAVVEGKGPFQDVNTVFLGFGVLVLAMIGTVAAWRARRGRLDRQMRVWVWAVIGFALLTLGPLLQIQGRYLFSLDNLLREGGTSQDVSFPLPFTLLHYLPVIKANRVPNRFSIVLSLALAMLVAYGTWILLRRTLRAGHPARTVVATTLLLVVALFDQVSAPLPLTDARIPAPYRVIRDDPGDFAILQLPLGWRNSFGTRGAERTQLQYLQSYHHKRLLAGNTSRNPDFKFDYFTRIPLFRALTETEMYQKPDAETLTRAQEQAGELMALYDLRYLVVHEPIPLRFPEIDTTASTRDLAFQLMPVDPRPVAEGDGAAVFRIRQPAVPDPLRVDFGAWAAAPYRGEGWNDDEDVFAATANWVLGRRAEVFFPVRDVGTGRELSLQIAPFAYAGAPAQKLTLSLNGHELPKAMELHEGWQVVTARVAAVDLREGLNTLVLELDHAVAPAKVLPGNTDARPLSAAVDWLEVGTSQ
jgi:hypothetical protein